MFVYSILNLLNLSFNLDTVHVILHRVGAFFNSVEKKWPKSLLQTVQMATKSINGSHQAVPGADKARLF